METAPNIQQQAPEPLVLRERLGRSIQLLTLNRPKKANALSKQLLRELSDHLDIAARDTGIACVILTGAGKTFSAGADITDMLERGVESYADPERLSLWANIEHFPKPIIAAVNGHALGGGLELALLCDIIIASADARFATPEIRLGSFPGDGGTQRLPRLVGKSFAMQMVLTGMTIDAALAERMGLVSEVVSAARLVERAQEIATDIAAMSSAITPFAKRAVNAAFDLPLDKGLEEERALTIEAFATEDRIEGLRAFRERRPPKFMGR